LIEAEQHYLFTTDVDYLTNLSAFFPKNVEKDNKQVDPQKVFVNELRNRIDAYFALVCRNVRDSVPKIIGTFLVRAAQDKLQFSIYDEINRNEALMQLLGEPESVTRERENVTKMLETLKKAFKAIKRDPDLSASINLEELEESKPANSGSSNPGIPSSSNTVAQKPTTPTTQTTTNAQQTGQQQSSQPGATKPATGLVGGK